MEHDGCKGCKYECLDEHLEPCIHCDGNKSMDYYKHMTNGDKIRFMSDEELAEWLTKITDDAQLYAATKCNYQWKEWLQSEAE